MKSIGHAPTSLLIRSWIRWQGSAVRAVMRSRKSRKIDLDKPLSMTSFSVSSTLWSSPEFTAFARALGRPRDAEAFLCRIFARVALTAAKSGELNVDRDGFAAILTTPLDPVPRVVGNRVYDALIASGIAIVVTSPDTLPVTLRPESVNGSAWGGDESDDVSATGSSRASPERGHARTREEPQAQNGHAVTLPVTSQDTRPVTPCEERRGENYPPPPSKGVSIAAAESNGHDVATRPLRPRERERFGRVLDYAVLLGTTAEQATARVDRDAHRRALLDDARIAELLAGRYAWVTRQKLARWLAEGRVGWRDRRAAAEQAPRRVTAQPVEQCQRHGRPMPCTTCDVAMTTPADPAVAAKAIADARATLSRRPVAAPTGTTAPPPRMTEEERAAVRLAGDLAEIPEGDARHEEAAGLLRESVRDRAWAERAAVLLDPLEAFGGT